MFVKRRLLPSRLRGSLEINSQSGHFIKVVASTGSPVGL